MVSKARDPERRVEPSVMERRARSQERSAPGSDHYTTQKIYELVKLQELVS